MECCILLCLLSPLLGKLLPRSGKCLILRLELCRTPWMGKLPPPWYYSTAIIPKDRDYRMKSWLASMLAGEFSLGSAMTDTKALQEKCKIMSCRYLIASTYLRRVAIFQFGLHTRFPSTSSLRPFTKKMMVIYHLDDIIMSKTRMKFTSWPNCWVAHKMVEWRIRWLSGA